MSEERPELADGVRVGVELFASDALASPPRSENGYVVDDDDYAPASGRYRAPNRGWRRTVTEFGQDAVEAAARAMGKQVGTVLKETLVGMDCVALPVTTCTGFVTSSVQLTFGVKLAIGAGKVVEAVLSADGEASVQIAVTLTRPVQPE